MPAAEVYSMKPSFTDELLTHELRWAADAITVQDACNLSGVVHAFSSILSEMCAAGLDTRARNSHPACIMFASKIADLTHWA